jgi:hypothetical protein
MKKRIYSWILASAYLVWGVLLFLAVPKFQETVSGFNISATLVMRTIFAFGPYGCLLLAVAIGVAIIFIDLRFHRRFVSLVFTVTLLLWVYCMTAFAITNFTRQMT